ncbi:MAG: hypothetical protein AAB215_05405, partial [Planctomycetota bacterium]
MFASLISRLRTIREDFLRNSINLSTPHDTLRTLYHLCAKQKTAQAVLCFDGATRTLMEHGFKSNPRFAWLITWALSDIDHGGFSRIQGYVHF